MNIRKKGAAIGFTATLLASMIAVIAAPFASASVAVTSAGTVPRSGTSATAASWTLAENSVNCFGVGANLYNVADGGYISIGILDSASAATVHWVAPVGLSAPGSLGASTSLQSAGASNNILTIRLTGHDDLNIEQIVTSAKISADSGAATGVIKAFFVAFAPIANPAATNQAKCVITLASTTTASGHLSGGPYAIGSTSFTVTLDAGSCDFQITNGQVGSTDVNAGNVVFVNENKPATNATTAPSVAGVQPVSTTAVVNPHTGGELVTQTVSNCAVVTFPFATSSPGTIASALTQTAGTPAAIVNVGENNQATNTTTLSESPSAAPKTLAAAMTVTWTITTAGVLFSNSPTATPSANVSLGAGAGSSVTCSISIDRKSCTITIASNAESTVPATGTESINLNTIRVDVASTAVPGSPVTILASTAPAVAINVSSAVVAFVGRVVVAVAAQPTIYIGFNDQSSGMKTLTEAGPGFFQAGLGSNNTFGLCIVTGETFTRAPWAVVVGTGDLKILNPATATGSGTQKGTLTNGGKCAYWTVFSASTIASTIEIRGSADDVTPLATGALNGPRLSVPNGLAPGSTQDALLIGKAVDVVPGCTTFAGCAVNPAFAGMLSQAIRAFKNSVTVTAASQPNCPPGTLDCLLGNVVITETQNGQLKAGDFIRGYFVPSATSLRNDVLIKVGNTNDLPIITTNSASGLLVSAVIVICPPNIPLLNVCFFAFGITQQSFGPSLGQITISNVHATITSGAQLGPIQMDWSNSNILLGVPVGPTPIGQVFESVVSNGNIGSGPNPPATTKTQAASAVTKTQLASAFSVSTKVVTLVSSSNNIVTIRIKVDPALIGKSVIIQRATKNSAGVWSSFTNLTTRTIGADGYAYYYASAHSAQWNSYRGSFPGNAQWAPSHSQTVQVRWV